ncbi:MAG: tetratricopeptide repeat protein [Planctomycetes bacterium]|nr:tetratricopeptide repeat protein [Planctomycetota bacterium]
MTEAPPAMPGDGRDPRRGDWRSILILHVVIVVAGLAVYANAIPAAFVFDDVPQIVERSGELSGDLRKLFRGDRRPVTTATLVANHALGGLDPRGYHAVNVLLHVAAACVLFGLVRRVVARRRGATTIGFAAALLWVVHPLQTESVTYVIQRSEVLAALAMFVVLYAVLRAGRAERGARWWAVAIVACALGMGAKPTMVVAPVLALVFDGIVVSSSWRAALRRRGALHAALACTWLVLVPTGTLAAIFGAPGDAGTPSAGFGVAQVTPLEYFVTQAGVIVHYVALAAWPRSLCIDPGWPAATTAREVVIPGALLTAAAVVTVVGAWRRRPIAFAGAAFFIWLAPTSSFVPIRDLAAEHRMYLPLAALAVLAVAGFTWLAPRLVGPSRAAVVGAVVLVAATTALGARSIVRNHDYRTPLALWTKTAEQVPHHRRPRVNLGVALHEAGRIDEAIDVLGAVVAERPGDALAELNYGSALAEAGRFGEALRYLEVAAPQLRRPDALLQLADTLRRAGRPEDAVETYRRAIERAPSAGAYLALGNALTEAERFDEAIPAFEEGARLARAARDEALLASALYNVGNTHFRLGRMDAAAAAYRGALDADPGHDGARRWLEESEARREVRE